jgi:hypothetical protein
MVAPHDSEARSCQHSLRRQDLPGYDSILSREVERIFRLFPALLCERSVDRGKLNADFLSVR